MHLRRCGASHEDGYCQMVALHQLRHAAHLVETRRYESGEAHYISIVPHRLVDNPLWRHHHSEVNDMESVARHDHPDDVLPYVVDIALHCRYDHCLAWHASHAMMSPLVCCHLTAAGVVSYGAAVPLGEQYGDSFLHRPRCLHHLRQEHLPLAEELSDDVHALHQRAADDVEWRHATLCQLGYVPLHCVVAPLGQSLLQSILWRVVGLWCGLLLIVVLAVRCPPHVVEPRFRFLLLPQYLPSHLCQTLCGVGSLVQYHTAYGVAQIPGNILIPHRCGGIHDSHVHSRLYGVVEEDGVHGLTQVVVAAEGEREV